MILFMYMNSKTFVLIGTIVGSTLGSLVPLLWGDGVFSFSSIFFSAVGAIVGIYYGYKLSNQ